MSTTSVAISYTLRPAQLRALSFFQAHPASTLPAMRKALKVDGRTNRAIAALCRSGLLVERKGSYWPNTGIQLPTQLPRAPRMPREYARTGKPTKPVARAVAPAPASPGRHVPHRNTSAAQKLALHFVDRFPGSSAETVAVACAHMSKRGADGLLRSIGRLVARGFLREDRTGVLKLARPLSTLPPAAQPLMATAPRYSRAAQAAVQVSP